jgi:hypothetical protein
MQGRGRVVRWCVREVRRVLNEFVVGVCLAMG